MHLPQGWVPRKPEAEVWYAARDITPTATNGVRLVILLPTPDPASGQLPQEKAKPRRNAR